MALKRNKSSFRGIIGKRDQTLIRWVEEKAPKRALAGKYDPDKTPEKTYRLCMLGLDETDLALALDISIDTLGRWKSEYPEFAEALYRGKELADGEVATSLYRKALGYSHPETEIRVVDGEVVTVDVIKHHPPDTTACIFWLKNRQRKNWRDVWNIRHEDKNGKELDSNGNILDVLQALDLQKLSIEELEVVASLGIKVKRETKELTNDNDVSQAKEEIIDV